MIECPSCHEENPAKFRLCGFCGVALQPAPPAQEQRKTVSLVFSDLVGSTQIGERLDPEAVRTVLTRYFDTMKAELMRHGGTIEKFIGDAIMAVFGIPVVREDDAMRAVRAAAGMREALVTLNRELERTHGISLHQRTGVFTGEVVTGDAATGQRLVTGDAVNTAARLEQAAGTDQILIGDLTWGLVRDAVEVEPVEPLELKGKAARVPAYRLLRIHGMEGRIRRGDAPLVGREHELVLIGESFRDAVAAGRPTLVTVVADAGTGKSRLVKEFTRSIAGEAVVLHGRCLPYGEGITFWPLLEIVRSGAAILPEDPPAIARQKLLALVGDRDVAARLAGVTGLAPTQFPLSEVQWAARRLVEVMSAGGRPVVAIVDDIHWAEPAFLELLDHVLEHAQAAMVILATSRPDLFEMHEDWGDRHRSVRLDLGPLSPEDAGRIVDALLGSNDLPHTVRDRIAEASEGNPLFAEQFLSMLIEQGVVRRTGEGWVATQDVTDFPIPPTISALLTARLDRLSAPERSVIEPASVIGLTFGRDAVSAMIAVPPPADLPAHLQALARKQLVRSIPITEGATTGEAFRFAHLLVRDATYGTLLKRTRAEFHERFVRWADADNARSGRTTEFEEILGWHLEQAYRYLVELGSLDEHAQALGRDAATRLSAAGRRAYARGDLRASASLFARASDLRQPHDPERLALQPDLAEVLLETGEFKRAREIVAAAMETADELFDDRLAARARMVGHLIDFYTGETGTTHEDLLRDAEAAIAIFERVGDHAGVARALRLATYLHGSAQRFGMMAEAADRLTDHARLAGDERLAARGAVLAAQALVYGPTVVEDAIKRSEEMLEGALDDRRTRAVVLGSLSELYAMAGDFDRARDAYLAAREMFSQLGNRLLASSVSVSSYRVELLAGDPERAADELARDRDALEALGEQQLRASVAGTLGWVEAGLGRTADAERHTAEAQRIAEADDVDAQARWRMARAALLSAAGDRDAADRQMAAALELLRGNEAIVLLADALALRAEINETAGRHDVASAFRTEATSLYEAKGDRVSASRTRRSSS